MSLAPGSTPYLLASLSFTFSLVSSSSTSCRDICFRVVRKLSLVRCSISRLVMGSPLIMQAMDCAGNGDTPPASTTAQQAATGQTWDQGRRERSLMVVMVMSAVSTNSYRVALGTV